MGAGVCRSTTREVEPQESVVRSRSPVVPQLGRPAPRAGPVVATTVKGRSCVLPLRQGFGSWASSLQEALEIERHLLAPQVVDRAAEPGFQDRECLALA